MFFALRLIENLLYLVSILYIAERLLLLRRRNLADSAQKVRLGLWMLLYVFFGVLRPEPIVSMLGLFFLTLLLFQLLYQGTRIQLVLYDLFSLFFLALMDEVAVLVIRLFPDRFFHSDSFDHDSVITNVSTSLLTLISLILISNLFWRRYSGYIREITMRMLALMTAVTFLDVIMVFALNFIGDEIERVTPYLSVASVFLVAGVYLQLGLLLPMIASIDIYRQKAELSRKYLEEQISHYHYLEQKDRDIRKFRHDMKNQMMTLNTLYREGRIGEFEALMEEINGKIAGFGSRVNLNNHTAEAIVNRFLCETEECGIHLKVQGKLPENCCLTGMEICTVLSNLLSNAMEAVRYCGGTNIELNLRYEGDEIYILLENDCLPELNFSGDRMKTGKEDKNSHGFGLENIRDCVKQHKGWLHMEASGGVFRTCIEMKNENTGGKL